MKLEEHCSLNAFAFALGLSLENLAFLCGHDGSEIIFPELRDPLGRRGFHTQELLLVAHRLGSFFMPLNFLPAIQHPADPHCQLPCGKDDDERKARINYLIGVIGSTTGVIEGMSRSTAHAVAYRNGIIYEGGREYPYEDISKTMFRPHTVWVKA